MATVPAGRAERLLKVLAYFKLVDPKMIEQHYFYFTTHKLKKLLQEAGFKKVVIGTWQAGFNIFMRAKK